MVFSYNSHFSPGGSRSLSENRSRSEGKPLLSQIFRSFEANSGDYLTKMIGKSDQKGFSAVGSLFSGRLLVNW